MRVLHALTLTVAAMLLGACGSHSASNGSSGIGPTDPTTGNGAGPGGAPHVRVFRTDGTIVGSFYAYEESFNGGVNVGSLKIYK